MNISQINCLDYESALFLESHLEEDVDLALVDDYENKDRSYIDTTKFVRPLRKIGIGPRALARKPL